MSRSNKAISLFVCMMGMPMCVVQYAWADSYSNTAGSAGEVQLSEGVAATSQPVASIKISGDLSAKTDTELTTLTAQWADLDPGERRKLLAEVRARMVANQKVRRPVGVRMRVQRQYGRVVRKSDGSVVVQTRVVQMTPRAVVSAPRSRVTFGIGFEQRSKSRQSQGEIKPQTVVPQSPQPSANSVRPVPAVTVSQQPKVSTEP